MNSNEEENLDLIDVELDLSDEVWVPIIGYEGKYALSNYGRVRNTAKHRGLTLAKTGHKIRCALTKNNKSESICISDIMPMYFPMGDCFDPDNFEYLNSLNKPREVLDDLDGELWKPIENYEGVYQVSSKGRVKSLSRAVKYLRANGKVVYVTTEDKIRVVSYDKDGYPQLILVDNSGARACWRVHKLVALAFIDNPSNLPQVNHIDGCKTNNAVENLEWVTSKENSIHAHKTGLAKNAEGAESSSAKFTWEEIRYIRSDTGLLQRELAEVFGVRDSTISLIQNYKTYKYDPMEENK